VGPPVGQYADIFGNQQITFAAIDNVKTFNHPVPRIGMIYDLTGKGRTVLKANYGIYYWNPGTTLSENVNNNSVDWYKDYNWVDRNGDLLWQRGEETTLFSSNGGAGSAVLDPNLKNTYTTEVSGWVEHELFPGFALQGGYVYRKIGDIKVQVNQNRPMDAYNIPVSIRDPGPDGVFGNADDGANIPGLNLDPAAIALGNINLYTNGNGDAEFHTVEIAANKRLANSWSLGGSYSMRWNRDQSSTYFGQTIRAVDTVSTPNDLINTVDGRLHFTLYTFKVNGTYEAPWAIRVTPAWRFQSGQPFARVIVATSTNGINYGTQRILAEPFGTQRQDNISVLDVRVEKAFTVAKTKVSGFFDVYNLGNSDAKQNITWASGSTYLLPSTVIGPRIMRFGVKYDW